VAIYQKGNLGGGEGCCLKWKEEVAQGYPCRKRRSVRQTTRGDEESEVSLKGGGGGRASIPLSTWLQGRRDGRSILPRGISGSREHVLLQRSRPVSRL